MIPDMGEDEPLEDGLPDTSRAVEDFSDIPTMEPVPIPQGFVPEDVPDLADLPMDPLD